MPTLVRYTLYLSASRSMAPRRSQAASNAQTEGSSSTSLHAELDTDRLNEAISKWSTDGQEIVKQILSSQADVEVASASTIPISSTLIRLIQSEVALDGLAECLTAVSESWDPEKKDVLWEALVDAVAVLSEDKEDSREIKSGEVMEVDGQQVTHPGDKGVQVIKALLVSYPT